MEVEAQVAGRSAMGSEQRAPGGPLLGDAATVPDSVRGTELGMVGRQQWEDIHRRSQSGSSISAIARDLGLDRKTVRTCLRQAQWQPYLRHKPRASLLDDHRDWLEQRAAQVGFSARVLYQELCSQRGFTGCYELVKVAVRPLRAAASVVSITQMRFETAPGEQAQVDWGQVLVWFGEERVRVHVFVMTLGYSRRGFAQGFLDERIGNVMAAHEQAFAHFGGCCQNLLYDRMRTVCLGTIEDDAGVRRARINPTLRAFADHWGFGIRLCRPYRPQTKGKVESGVKYIKRNFVPGRVFADIEDFNAQLAAWQMEVADVREHGTTHQRPIDRFADEAPALTPTAGHASFLQAIVRERVVADDWLVSIDANRYSVPFALIGKTVQVVREEANWVIRYRGRVGAEHAVLEGRAQLSIHPEHGPGAMTRNQRLRYAGASARPPAPPPIEREVQIRDLAVYEQLAQEAA